MANRTVVIVPVGESEYEYYSSSAAMGLFGLIGSAVEHLATKGLRDKGSAGLRFALTSSASPQVNFANELTRALGSCFRNAQSDSITSRPVANAVPWAETKKSVVTDLSERKGFTDLLVEVAIERISVRDDALGGKELSVRARAKVYRVETGELLANVWVTNGMTQRIVFNAERPEVDPVSYIEAFQRSASIVAKNLAPKICQL